MTNVTLTGKPNTGNPHVWFDRGGRILVALTALAASVMVLPLQAAKTCTWTGGGADNNWSTPENWGGTDASACPAAGDTVELSNDGIKSRIINNDIAGLALASLQFLGENPLTLTGEGVSVSSQMSSFKCDIQNGTSTNDIPMTYKGSAQDLTFQGNIVLTKKLTCQFSSGKASLYVRGTRTGGSYALYIDGGVDAPERVFWTHSHKTGASIYIDSPITVATLKGDGGNSAARGKTYLNSTGNVAPIVYMGWGGLQCLVADALDPNSVVSMTLYTESNFCMLMMNGHDQTIDRIEASSNNNRWISSTAAARLTMNTTADASSTAVFEGPITIAYNPPSSETTYTIAGGTHTTTGDLIVSNGTFVVGGASSFAKVKNVAVSEGANLTVTSTAATPFGNGTVVLKLETGAAMALPENGTLAAKELWVDGVRQDGGTYTHANLPQLSDNGASISVPNWTRDPITFTWTGGGEKPVWSDPANWDVGEGQVPKAGCNDNVILSNDGTTPVITNDLAGLTLGSIKLEGSRTVTLDGLGVRLKAAGSFFDNITGSVVSTNRIPLELMDNADITAKSDLVILGGVTNLSEVSKSINIKVRTANKKVTFKAPVYMPNCTISLSEHITNGEIHFEDLVTVKGIYGDGGNHSSSAGLVYIHKTGSTFGEVNPRENGIHCQAENVFGEACGVLWRYYAGGADANKGVNLHGFDQVIDRPYSVDTEYGSARCFTTDEGATLTMKATASSWSNCGFNKNLSVMFAPADGATTYEARNSTSTMTGTLTVSNGTFRISGTSTFAKVGTIDILDGASLVVDSTAENPLGTQQVVLKLATDASLTLPANSTVSVKELWIDGVRQEGNPALSHDTLPQLTDNGAKIAVPEIQREPVAFTWNAGAGANTSVSAAENWVGDVAPNLDNGTADATFATAGTTATLGSDAKFYGLHFDGAATEFVVNGTGAATLYGGTISSTAARTSTVDVAVTLKKDLMVDVAAGAVVDLKKDVREADGFQYGLTKTGAGELVLRGENAFSGNVKINGGKISLYSAKDGLVKEGSLGTVEAWESSGARLDLYGAEIASDFKWVPGQNCEERLRFMSGVNLFKGKFSQDGSWQFRPYVNGGSTNIFEGGYNCAACYQEFRTGAKVDKRAEMVFRKVPFSCNSSSCYMSVPSYTTMRLQVASNHVTCLNFRGDYAILSCEVPYALKNTVDFGFPGTYSNYGKMELNGHDQELGNLALSSGQYSNTDAQFTSSAPATFAYNQTIVSTNTVVDFAGQLNLVQKGTAKGGLIFARDYNATGTVSVVAGTLGFTGAAKAPNVTNVTVSAGAKLEVVRRGTFPKNCTLDLAADAASAKAVVDLAAGAELRCAALTIGGAECRPGTYGSSASPADHKDDAHFSGMGVVKCGKIGLALIIR